MISSTDFMLLEWLHHNRIESLDVILRWFSEVTTFVSLGLIVGIGIWSIYRKAGTRMIFQISVTLIVAGLCSFTLKSLIPRERPFRSYETIQKLGKGGSSSFPSGHTLEAFAMATAISLLFRKRKIQVPVIIWALLVGYSRMALGVHYPTDVLGGMVLGIILAMGIDFLFRRYFNRPYSRT